MENSLLDEKHLVKKGYIISICPTCKKECSRFVLYEDTEIYSSKCDLGHETNLIVVSEDEMRDIISLYDNE